LALPFFVFSLGYSWVYVFFLGFSCVFLIIDRGGAL